MDQLHVLFFPMMAHGHMIPMLDIAKLFAARGAKSTIITTPLNASFFTRSIRKESGLGISVRTIEFRPAEVGFPENCENMNQIPTPDMVPLFFKATTMLREPLEKVLEECRPDCLVADMFFPWATEAAAKFGIPRLVFHGISIFSLCVSTSLRLYKPHVSVSSDNKPFIVPNLPHEIKFTRDQLPVFHKNETENDFSVFLREVSRSEVTSYGVLVNSFYQLEPEYADHYQKVLGIKSWHIGPVSLCNVKVEDKARRGTEAAVDGHGCLNWLNSKKPRSVVYVCFGSMANFTYSQLFELAMGLEDSGQQFIWVVRGGNTGGEDGGDGKWLPEGFEKRTREKGLIIRNWAPQVLILDHEAIGCFITHCGWNSALEGVSAGVPMVTWPLYAEQFYNEKLVTEILRTGVGVGAQKWSASASEGIKREAIAEAVKKVMVGEVAEELRNRARMLKNMAKRAVDVGGSSHSDLNALCKELKSFRDKTDPTRPISYFAGDDIISLS